MRTILRVLLALSIIAVIVAATPSYAGEDGSNLVPSNVLSGLESGIFKYTNAHRVDVGAPAFTESSPADDMARSFSLTLVKSGFFSHDQPGMPYAERLKEAAPCGDECAEAAENIYQIDYPSMQAFLADVQTDAQIDKMAKDIVDGWLASPGHKRNIEDPLLESLGVGVAVTTDGKVYATQDFIRTTPLTEQQFQQIQGSVHHGGAGGARSQLPALNPNNQNDNQNADQNNDNANSQPSN